MLLCCTKRMQQFENKTQKDQKDQNNTISRKMDNLSDDRQNNQHTTVPNNRLSYYDVTTKSVP